MYATETKIISLKESRLKNLLTITESLCVSIISELVILIKSFTCFIDIISLIRLRFCILVLFLKKRLSKCELKKNLRLTIRSTHERNLLLFYLTRLIINKITASQLQYTL